MLAHFEASKVATTALACAVEVLEDHPLLDCDSETTLPLLTPVNAMDKPGIEKEIEAWLAQGFRTFKVKVGKDVDADLARVAHDSEGSRQSRHASPRCQSRLQP